MDLSVVSEHNFVFCGDWGSAPTSMKGAVSKRLKQAMRGSAFFRNIFGQAKTECRKNGTQGIIFMRNFQVE